MTSITPFILVVRGEISDTNGGGAGSTTLGFVGDRVAAKCTRDGKRRGRRFVGRVDDGVIRLGGKDASMERKCNNQTICAFCVGTAYG